jgi:hypothetical protein
MTAGSGVLRPLVAVTRVLVITLVVLAAGVVVGPQPAGACSCAAETVDPSTVLARGGLIEGQIAAVEGGHDPNDYTPRPVTVSVTRAFGTDPGSQVVLPGHGGDSSACGTSLAVGREVVFFADAEELSLCSIITADVDEALAVPGPVLAGVAVRYLGHPVDPDRSVAGYAEDGRYVGQLAIPPLQVITSCPGEAVAIGRHGEASHYTGTEAISWATVDLATLASAPLVDIAAVSPDPMVHQNVPAGITCLEPDGSDVLLRMSWWERPDEKPQRLVRIHDGMVTEVLVAPIWEVWGHDGTAYARTGTAGTDIVTIDLDTGQLTPHGSVPVDDPDTGLTVDPDGTWGLLADMDPIAGTGRIRRVGLIPDVAVTAETSRPGYTAVPLADGRTVLQPFPTDAGRTLLLDEALTEVASTELTGAVTVGDDGDLRLLTAAGERYRWPADAQPILELTGIPVGALLATLPRAAVPAVAPEALELPITTYPVAGITAPASDAGAEPSPTTGVEPARSTSGSTIGQRLALLLGAAAVLGVAAIALLRRRRR